VTAGGNVSYPSTPRYTAVREALEEASLDARKAELTGWVNIRMRNAQGWLLPGLYHQYELEIDALSQPRAHDGEAEGFELMGTEQLIKALRNSEFKYSSAISLVHFMLRHQMIVTDPSVPETLVEPWALPLRVM
jgi:8-oxo-dGTP pyrophosphatase MutT (NUDIX family)